MPHLSNTSVDTFRPPQPWHHKHRSPPPLRHLPLFLLAAISIGASAQPSPAATQSTADQPARVEINGSLEVTERRDATAAKLLVTRDDIARFGDTQLADVLRRVPGITIGGSGSQAREIRMRGLGGGYTQILVNGEPVAAGFSLDSLSPDLIERIEVVRSATADMSPQSIAGTINIILRRTMKAGQRELKVGASTYAGLGSGTLTAQTSDRHGAWSYSLAGNVSLERKHLPALADTSSQSANAAEPIVQRANIVEQSKQLAIGITPRISWKPNENHMLSIDGLLQAQRLNFDGDERRTALFGAAPAIAHDLMHLVNDSLQARGSANWKSPAGEDGRLDTKLTATFLRRISDGTLDRFNRTQSQLVYRTVDSRLQDSSVALSGKYSLPIGDGHLFAAGWDGQITRRTEDRIQRETSKVGFPTENMDDDFRATIGRLALYAQDEWTITPRLSAYAGLRWEGLETKTAGITLTPVQNRSSVFSPTTQMVWKVPSTKADQVRISLARTYKAPTAKELIPRRWIVNDNSATRPNFQGNPDLTPELSWGLDAGYERYLPAEGFLGINAYARRIDNVILQRIFNDNGVWISTPTNNGDARVFGIELEAKAKLHKMVADLPHIDLRTGMTRNWSKVSRVPGPGNRLSQQPSFTTTIGVDYQPTDLAWTFGGQFSYERANTIRSSATQTTTTASKRVLDFYGLWPINKTTRLRMTLANLIRPDAVTESQFADSTLTQSQILTQQSYRSVRLLLDMRL